MWIKSFGSNDPLYPLVKESENARFSCAKPAAGCQYSVGNINMEPYFGPSHPLCPTLMVKIHDIQVSLCKTSCSQLTITIWSQKRWEDKLGGGTGCKYNSSFINEPPSSAPLCTLLPILRLQLNRIASSRSQGCTWSALVA